MGWVAEVEPEAEAWLLGLAEKEFGRAQFYIDLLEREGPQLGEPYTRQLRGRLRELRFYLERERVRITYYLVTGRRIILLTVFKKTKARETREVDRAERAMRRCIEQGHTAEESDG